MGNGDGGVKAEEVGAVEEALAQESGVTLVSRDLERGDEGVKMGGLLDLVKKIIVARDEAILSGVFPFDDPCNPMPENLYTLLMQLKVEE